MQERNGESIIKAIYSVQQEVNANTFLHYDCNGKNKRISHTELKILLENDVYDVNSRGLDGNTILHLFLYNKRKINDSILLLLNNGANPLIKDSAGKMPEKICKHKELRKKIEDASDVWNASYWLISSYNTSSWDHHLSELHRVLSKCKDIYTDGRLSDRVISSIIVGFTEEFNLAFAEEFRKCIGDEVNNAARCLEVLQSINRRALRSYPVFVDSLQCRIAYAFDSMEVIIEIIDSQIINQVLKESVGFSIS